LKAGIRDLAQQSLQEQDLVPYSAAREVARCRALMLAPHPDDEVLGCAGAILRTGSPVAAGIVLLAAYVVADWYAFGSLRWIARLVQAMPRSHSAVKSCGSEARAPPAGSRPMLYAAVACAALLLFASAARQSDLGGARAAAADVRSQR
jgi:hypothetical protein